MTRRLLRDAFSKRRLTSALVAVGVLLIAPTALGCGGSEQKTADSLSGSVATSGQIVFDGLLDYPMTFTTVDMDYMEWVTVSAEDQQGRTTQYQGVRLRDLFSYVGVQAGAKTVVVDAADGSSADLTLASIEDDAVLTLTDNDKFVLVMPGLPSASWPKDVVRMTFK